MKAASKTVHGRLREEVLMIYQEITQDQALTRLKALAQHKTLTDQKL
jgi:hypothetical protein